MNYAINNKKIFVAGHNGMVGSAICRRLKKENCEILTINRKELDLRDSKSVLAWMKDNQPHCVIVAAAKVGGIYANSTYPVDFLQDNLLIQNSIISAAHAIKAERLLFLGSSCIYPKHAEQPMVESSLLSGSLEPTNEPYAIAKIAGIKLVEAYRRQYGHDWISAMPTNLYGPGDNYHPDNSHVLPALINRFHNAKLNKSTEVVIWGTGAPLREFMYSDDLADALIFCLQNYSSDEHINIGTGEEISIKNLAEIIANTVGGEYAIKHDVSKPDGTMRKLMCSQKLRDLGWSSKTSLVSGLQKTYANYVETLNKNALRQR